MLVLWLCLQGVVFAHYRVQAGAFRYRVHAVRLAQSVSSLTGYKALIDRATIKKNIYYLVSIPNLVTQQQLKEVTKRLAEHHINYRVLKRPDTPSPGGQRIYREPEPIEPVYHPHIAPSQMHVVDKVYPKDLQRTHVARRLTLRESVMLSLRHNPSVTNAEIDRINQKYSLLVSRREFEWQYTLTGHANWAWQKQMKVQSTSQAYQLTPQATRKTAYGTQFILTLDNVADANNYNPKASLNVTQPLLKGSRRRVVQSALHDALDDEKINKLSLKQTIIATVDNVARKYLDLIQDNNNVATRLTALQDSEKTLSDNKVRIRLGKRAKATLLRDQATVEQNRFNWVQSTNSRDQNLQSLLQTIGLDPGLMLQVPDDLIINNLVVPDLERSIDYALHHNIDYQRRLIQYNKSKRDVFVREDDLRWQLDLTADTSVGGGVGGGRDEGLGSLTNGRNMSQSVGLTLSVPIDQVPLKAALERAKIRVIQDKAELQQAKRDLVTSIKNTIINIKSLVEQINIAKQTVDLNRRDFDLEKKKQILGRATSLDVSLKQRDLTTAQVGLINAKISYAKAMITLRSELGSTLDYWGIKVRY